MNSIYRTSLEVADYQEVPLSGTPISVAADRDGRSGCFDLWFEHMADCTALPYAVYVFGTGNPVPWGIYTRHAWQFIGTVVTPAGLVWHIYTGPGRGVPIPV